MACGHLLFKGLRKSRSGVREIKSNLNKIDIFYCEMISYQFTSECYDLKEGFSLIYSKRFCQKQCYACCDIVFKPNDAIVLPGVTLICTFRLPESTFDFF